MNFKTACSKTYLQFPNQSKHQHFALSLGANQCRKEQTQDLNFIFYVKTLEEPAISNEVFELQRKYNFPGLVQEGRKLITKYGLPNIIDEDIKLSKTEWKNTVRRKVIHISKNIQN